MADELKPCSSHIVGSGFYDPCKDGFPQTSGICLGTAHGKVAPVCCDERRAGRLYPITGEPFREKEARRAVTAAQEAPKCKVI